ncbi:MAG TPA: ExeM/NucH family extracellular endonuclease [Marinobacter sp.]|nr:ExeM/NucH family extracellular endonuclease [Marinobacter sp.]
MTSYPRFILAILLCAVLPSAGAAGRCGDPAIPMHQIQSAGHSSPLAGKRVTVEGILTRDARAKGGFNGFYLQQADDETDNDPATSEALFVYTGKSGGAPGQRLRVTGTVKEFHGLTELVGVRALTVCGTTTLPEPIDVSLPWEAPPEHLENMLVRFSQPLTIIDHYNLALFGELTLAARDQVIPTEYLPPGPRSIAHHQHNQLDRVVLDDGMSQRHPKPVPWLSQLNTGRPIRAGDQVAGLEGVLDFRFGQWRLQPTRTPEFIPANPRPEPPAAPAAGDIRVLAVNLQNYFNGDGNGRGFPTARGAASAQLLERQTRRLTSAILATRPDILAVSELENDGYGPNSAISQLASALGKHWKITRTPGQDGDDAIRTALLYRADRVQPEGVPSRLRAGPFQSQGRPPIAQSFRPAGGGLAIRIVVPHFKSKSCRNARGADTDQHDGQACYNHRRTLEAEALARWLDTLPTPDRTAGTLITGDLNSYAMEAPIQALRKAGFDSLIPRFHPCRPERCPHHSYRYQGGKGSLDHSLADAALMPRITRVETWNINADEARAIAYNQAPGPGTEQPWRASDHNPLLTDIRLGTH